MKTDIINIEKILWKKWQHRTKILKDNFTGILGVK